MWPGGFYVNLVYLQFIRCFNVSVNSVEWVSDISNELEGT